MKHTPSYTSLNVTFVITTAPTRRKPYTVKHETFAPVCSMHYGSRRRIMCYAVATRP